ncbi:hypothetical protein ACFWNN_16580 [Lentzea sp. NPDC058450]|uniref:hypothetical protein n=1 Tax=Lentzea sp. NPDC058450 TaxID=3346505 RepID=UPI0036542DBB
MSEEEPQVVVQIAADGANVAQGSATGMIVQVGGISGGAEVRIENVAVLRGDED